MINLDDLPFELLPFKNNILATVKPVIEITLSPADDLPLWASKVGGKPYLPLDVEYPFSSDGNPLKLLAQINFSEIPTNDTLPKTGILSFFIENSLDKKYVYGADYSDLANQDGFKVFYFEEIHQDISKLKTDFSEFESYWNNEDTYSPLNNNDIAYKMVFSNSQELMPEIDFHTAEHFFGLENYYDIYKLKGDEKKILRYLNNIDSTGHKLLGYPYFTQIDPRIEHAQFRDYILLFQLDSEDENGINISWGDFGVGNFFIHPNDLNNKDFSKVIYTWDCG